jgi:hypothetical protein
LGFCGIIINFTNKNTVSHKAQLKLKTKCFTSFIFSFSEATLSQRWRTTEIIDFNLKQFVEIFFALDQRQDPRQDPRQYQAIIDDNVFTHKQNSQTAVLRW